MDLHSLAAFGEESIALPILGYIDNCSIFN
jgi:hypothetical protein